MHTSSANYQSIAAQTFGPIQLGLLPEFGLAWLRFRPASAAQGLRATKICFGQRHKLSLTCYRSVWYDTYSGSEADMDFGVVGFGVRVQREKNSGRLSMNRRGKLPRVLDF
jgi:hypothetical protein